jgi:hypothetical protein
LMFGSSLLLIKLQMGLQSPYQRSNWMYSVAISTWLSCD